jgi:TetR/AcrR family transcriptional repressor of nem operon
VTQTVPARTLTVKGERTRGKIVDTAATLMLNDGVAGTTIEGGAGIHTAIMPGPLTE